MVAIMRALATPCSDLAKDASALDASISACRSSIKVLESSLNATEGSSAGWETFAWICAVVVAIGVAAEIVGIVWEYRDDLREWRRGILRPPSRPSFVLFFWFEILATVLVVAGVFGEAWASKELAFINSQLRSTTSELRADSDQLLALVTQEAGDAVSNAQLAEAAAKGAGTKADAAGHDALSAQASAHQSAEDEMQLRADLAAATKALSNSQGEFEKEEADIEESQKILNDFETRTAGARPLRLDLGKDLRAFPPAEATITYVNRPEPHMLADTLALSLHRAGWNKIDGPNPTGADGPDVPKGVKIYDRWTSVALHFTVEVNPDGSLTVEPMRGLAALNRDGMVPGDERLRLATLAAALDATLEKRSDLPANKFIIVIGTKN